jgi:tellurite resistance protein
MSTLARIASVLLAAATLTAPLAASAKPSSAKPKDAAAHVEKDKAQFPMKADEFRKMIDKRIERVKAHVEHSMEKHKLPAPQRAEVTKAVDAAVKEVRAAVDKAAADGVVTKDEAKQVRELAEQLRSKLRAELGGGKHANKHGKAKHRDRKGS